MKNVYSILSCRVRSIAWILVSCLLLAVCPQKTLADNVYLLTAETINGTAGNYQVPSKHKFTNTSGTVYTYTITSMPSTEFYFRVGVNGWDKQMQPYTNGDALAINGSSYIIKSEDAFYGSDKAWKVSYTAGEYTSLTITIDISSNRYLKVTGVKKDGSSTGGDSGDTGGSGTTTSGQGWPAGYGGVMLQGFYWDSYDETKWTNLTKNVDELSKYFDLIWVPNSGKTSSFYHNGSNSMGYDPCFWFDQNSCFGTEPELRAMIKAYKKKGTGIIADVVINHKNGLNDWCDFPEEHWNGNDITWSLADICSDDEAAQHGYAVSGNKDEGDNFDGYRDLDHTSANVQKNVKLYEDFLLHDIGYTGFRYDMVKGFAAYYVGMYNASSKPKYSVGEYWDSSYDNVKGWITGKDGTSNFNGTIQSAAFDFPMKYGAINNAFGSNNFTGSGGLSNKGLAGDNVNGMNRYSVTFVDNHDTYRNDAKLSKNVLAANAFILAMPGTPCIFLPHWNAYKSEIEKMIMARKAAGITNTSSVTSEKYDSDGDGYYATVKGTKGTILIIAGYVTDNVTNGYTVVSSGNATNPNYAFYISNDCADTYKSYLNGSENPTADQKLIKEADGTATGIVVPFKPYDVSTKNAPAYNLAGQRVGKDYKGVVIINGKKVIRK